MSEFSKQALKVENNTNFPNNSTGYITPVLLREFNTDMIDSTVNQIVYTEDSQSWESSIESLNNFTASAGGLSTGSLMVTASAASNVITFTKGDGTQFNVTVADTTDLGPLNSFSASAEVSINALNVFTSSNGTTQLNEYTASNTLVVNSLVAATASYADSASVENQIESLQAQIDALDPSGSAEAIIALNEFTASQLNINSGYNSYTASNSISISALNTFSSSQESKDLTLASYTGSNDTKWSNLGGQSGSWVTESETGSFARVDVSNTFTADQTINGTLNVTTINATTIHTIIESSSVIFSSGSNILGDELTDTQTLSGSVMVQGSLTVNGTPVQTSSVDISALNAFTQSAQSQLTALESATASYANSASVAAVDAGQQSQIDNLIAWTSSVVPTDISALNQATASLQAFTSSAQISIDNLNSTTASLNTSVSNLNSFTASQQTLNTTLATTGSNTFNGNQIINGALTASLTEGYVWAGGAGNVSTLVATSSFGGGGGGDLTSLNAFTASQEILNTTFATTGSNVFDGTQVVSGSILVSGSIDLFTEGGNGFAYSGKALFLTNSVQTGITIESPIHFYQVGKGDMYIQNNVAGVGSGSMNILAANNANLDISSSAYRLSSSEVKLSPSTFTVTTSQPRFTTGLQVTGSINAQSDMTLLETTGTTTLTLGPYATAGEGTGARITRNNTTRNSNIQIYASSSAFVAVYVSGSGYFNALDIKASSTGSAMSDYNGTAYTSVITFPANVGGANPAPIFPRGLEASGSLSALTARVSGSLTITGSAKGNVVALGITSNTASMDLNAGNYFTLTLADTATTHITATNIQPGVSATLVITTGTNSSASLAPILLEPSGSEYVATNGSAKKDVLSFVSVDSTNAFVVSTKNMI